MSTSLSPAARHQGPPAHRAVINVEDIAHQFPNLFRGENMLAPPPNHVRESLRTSRGVRDAQHGRGLIRTSKKNRLKRTDPLPQHKRGDGLLQPKRVDGPLQNRRVNSPPNQERLNAPPQLKRVDAPQQQKRTDSPPGEERLDAPPQHKRMDMPLNHKRVEAPLPHKRVEAPIQHKRVEAPAQQRRGDSPPRQERTDAPAQQEHPKPVADAAQSPPHYHGPSNGSSRSSVQKQQPPIQQHPHFKAAAKREQPRSSLDLKSIPVPVDTSPVSVDSKAKPGARPQETFEEIQYDMERWHVPNKSLVTCTMWKRAQCPRHMRQCSHFHGEIASGRRLGAILQAYKRQFYEFLEIAPKDLIVVCPPGHPDHVLYRVRSAQMKPRVAKVMEVLSCQTPGWERWISGELGWDYGPFNKKDIVEQLRVSKEILSKTGVLANGSRERLRLTHSAYEDNITSVRKFIEYLMFRIKALEKSGSLTFHVEEVRRILLRLLRTSKNGPDVPCQWSAHAQENPYPLAFVTEKSQRELSKGMRQVAMIISENGLFSSRHDPAALPDLTKLTISPVTKD